MAAFPYAGILEAAIINIINALQPSMRLQIDENGAMLPIPMYSVYSPLLLTSPSIRVDLRPSVIPVSLGIAAQYIDTTSNQVVHSIYAPQSVISLLIYARNDPERRVIADSIISHFLMDYYQDPTTGELGEAADLWSLSTTGIVFRAFEPIKYMDSSLTDSRPDGQPFMAEVPMAVDMWIGWTTPAYVLTTISSTTSIDANPMPGTPLGDQDSAIPNPTVIFPSPTPA